MENWLVVGSGGREYVIAETLAKKINNDTFLWHLVTQKWLICLVLNLFQLMN